MPEVHDIANRTLVAPNILTHGLDACFFHHANEGRG
ncbi:hypothetical protein BLA13014_00144 [Burkholderia aenigmatica]|uniref:Uncharacterized protein n=1 Tax=Burkholderia aenigmatica TaxID=2015348 RepID=A0A6P2H066_9BURK|nr:hypothetical protein BLA13014_00144 [Burkholderia aenigmatica]